MKEIEDYYNRELEIALKDFEKTLNKKEYGSRFIELALTIYAMGFCQGAKAEIKRDEKK